ncbi:hypothetical protein [Pseudomonas sp. BIC9C]|uniref:hypothetical protein n=1 Tax=Pseudomonas sp. BIC9C TaxID=3078458 RepID=UPI002AD28DEB|nr:hypothetical protein [Pseudomonas sp. BIC9C]
MKPAELFRSLLIRGDEVSIQSGRLVIQPASGKPVPAEWLNEHGEVLTAALLSAFGRHGFRYLGHRTGRYGGGRFQGVTLQFVDLLTGEDVCAVFNAQLTRERTTKAGRKGDPLPQGQFRVGVRHELWKLWCASGLPEPRRRSELCEVMHKLGGVLIEGDRHETQPGRLVVSTVRPISIDSDQVRAAFGVETSRQAVGKESASSRQLVGKVSASPVGKETEQSAVAPGLEPDSNRVFLEPRKKQEVNKEQRKHESFPCPVSPSQEHQSVDDWLVDYDRRDAELLAEENLSNDPAERLAGYLAEFKQLTAKENYL